MKNKQNTFSINFDFKLGVYYQMVVLYQKIENVY